MKKIMISIAALLLLAGCKKYLDEKSDKKLVVPSSLADLQSILDAYSKMSFGEPGEGEVSSTDYYITDANYNSLSKDNLRRLYTWQKDYLFESLSNSWYFGYTSIYAANSVLDQISSVPPGAERDNIKGQAHFFRAKQYLNLAGVFTPAYDPATAGNDLGLPLRLNTDFNAPSVRASNEATYQQIISDLKAAIPLLPVMPLSPIRPSKPAAYGLLARTYLFMRRYPEAGRYADSCLQHFSRLIDYNTLNAAASYPLAQFNAETIFFSVMATPAPINPSRAKTDPDLYNQYTANDLRKTVFFKRNTDGTYAFKGNYSGMLAPFGGLSTNEILLIRAEAAIRQNQTTAGMEDLNTLLKTRWKTGTFVPFTAALPAEALELVLKERRKELLNRGLRWMDIKRLNKEGANITLSRTVAGQVYTLPPNDPRYALPIPEDVIQLSGMPQNFR